MRTWIVFLAAAFMGAPASAAGLCDLSRGLISANSPLAPELFSTITSDMTVSEILRRLGPAARFSGPGVFILEWNSTDGRIFRVTTAGLCDRPLKLEFVPKATSNNRFERSRVASSVRQGGDR
jgi:hypothetical protein